MPVILKVEDYGLWLDPKVREIDKLKPLLRPYPASEMIMQPVSNWVNSPDNEGAKCIEQATVQTVDNAVPKPRKRRGEDPNQLQLF
jgi:putative SOS response-associated peptidase YedK